MNICLLGASGSIGVQTLDVIENNRDRFTLVSFSVGKRHECIPEILNRHQEVKYVYLIDGEACKRYQKEYPNVKFSYQVGYSSFEGLCNLIKNSDPDMVVNALVGFLGLFPSITALEMNKKLALANKESLVVAGELINNLLKEGHGSLYPIDSEHSALWKCLKVDDQHVEKLILTASGGAFRKLSREELVNVTASDALKHPTWKMGNKITIDCATMVNKAFELIEAYYLFGYKSDKLDITLHDESELHSYIKYEDGLYRGELNKPDMRNPIKFALFEGDIPFDTVSFSSLEELEGLHFHKFDINRYPAVNFAFQVIDKGGNLGAIINSANEEAVNAFLQDKIPFLAIEKIINKAIKNIPFIAHPTLDELYKSHVDTSLAAKEWIYKGEFE